MDKSFWITAGLSGMLTIIGAIIAFYNAYHSQQESIKDKAKADSINEAHQQLLKANYDKSLNIIDSLNEASIKTRSLLENTNEVLKRQNNAAELLYKQFVNSTELLQKTNVALSELMRNNYLFKDVKIQFRITYDYNDPNNEKVYNNEYTLNIIKKTIQEKINAGNLKINKAFGFGPNGQGYVSPTGYKNLSDELTYQEGINTYYITKNDANHTLLLAESITFPNAPANFQDVTPTTQKTLLSFQHQLHKFTVASLSGQPQIKPELLMSKVPNQNQEYVINTILDFQENKVIKTIQMPLTRRENNNSFKSLVDLQGNYLIFVAGNAIASDVSNVTLMFGDDYATTLNLDQYTIEKHQSPWGDYMTIYHIHFPIVNTIK